MGLRFRSFVAVFYKKIKIKYGLHNRVKNLKIDDRKCDGKNRWKENLNRLEKMFTEFIFICGNCGCFEIWTLGCSVVYKLVFW